MRAGRSALGGCAFVCTALAAGLVGAPLRAEPIPVGIADDSTWTFTIEHTRERQRGEVRERRVMTTVKELNWRKSGPSAGVIRVKPVSMTMEEGLPENLAALRDLDIPITVEVDEALAPVRLVNLDDVRTAFNEMLKRLDSDPKATGQLKQIFPNLEDATITAVTTQDLARVALAQASDLELGQERTYDDQAINPLGGPLIATKGSFRLEAFDKGAGRALVIWRLVMDPASMQKSMRATMDRMLLQVPPESAQKARAAFATMKIERQDICRYEIHLATGLATTVDCTANVVAGVEGQMARGYDRWLITQTLPRANP